MTEETFETKLAEMETVINALPVEQRARLISLLAETKHRHQGLRPTVVAAHDALADWRIVMKYQIFDAEARLREARQ